MARKAARRDARLGKLDAALAAVYTPGVPIEDPDLFSGRDELLADLRADLPVGGRHFVLYGERGVGKTSLWHVLLHDRKVQRHSASASDDFVSIFLRVLEALGEQFTADQRKNLAEVSSSLGQPAVGSVGTKSSEEATEKPVALRSLDLNFVLDGVARQAKHLDAVVIDEFQNISKEAVQTQIIEVVKGFADRSVDVKILLVGVADSDDELIPSHEYAQYKGRHFAVHQVERMSDEELRNIITLREQRFHVRFDEHVEAGIVRVASGYPSTAHELALRSAQAWVRRAFVGHAADFLLRIASAVVALPFLATLTVKKAGVDVEQQDLKKALERFHRDFQSAHRDIAERYEEAASSEHAETVDRVLLRLAASSKAKVSLDELASTAGLTRSELDTLLDSDALGLVEVADQQCSLTVREVRPYIEASRYIASLEQAPPPPG